MKLFFLLPFFFGINICRSHLSKIFSAVARLSAGLLIYLQNMYKNSISYGVKKLQEFLDIPGNFSITCSYASTSIFSKTRAISPATTKKRSLSSLSPVKTPKKGGLLFLKNQAVSTQPYP